MEDVGMGMVPVTGADVRVSPQDEISEQVVANALSLRDHDSDLAWATHEFFNLCAQRIMAFGEDVYEIVYLAAAEGESSVDFRLAPIHPVTVAREGNKVAQYVPRIRRDENTAEYIDLPPDRTAVFEAPKHLREPIAQTMRSLSSLDDFGLPDFALQELGETHKRIPFDTRAHIRTHKLAVADASRPLGWMARGLIEEDMLEYYVLHRSLKFERFKIELRNHILGTLNETLERAGSEVGTLGQLELLGLPSVTDVDAAASHLAAGDRAFKDIVQPFRPSIELS